MTDAVKFWRKSRKGTLYTSNGNTEQINMKQTKDAVNTLQQTYFKPYTGTAITIDGKSYSKLNDAQKYKAVMDKMEELHPNDNSDEYKLLKRLGGMRYAEGGEFVYAAPRSASQESSSSSGSATTMDEGSGSESQPPSPPRRQPGAGEGAPREKLKWVEPEGYDEANIDKIARARQKVQRGQQLEGAGKSIQILAGDTRR